MTSEKKESIINIMDCVGKGIVFHDRFPDLQRRHEIPPDLEGTWAYANAYVAKLSRSKKYVCILRIYENIQDEKSTVSPGDDSILSDFIKTLDKHGMSMGSRRSAARIFWLAVGDFADDDHPNRRFQVMDYID